jgi:ribose transport system substrate-binding protein
MGVFSTSFLCVEAAMAAGMENDIKMVAFDAEPQTLDYMEQGLIQATHVQRTYYMGYLAPYLLYAVNAIGMEETKALVSDLMVDDERIDTGLDVIPADGIEAYNDFMDALGVLN